MLRFDRFSTTLSVYLSIYISLYLSRDAGKALEDRKEKAAAKAEEVVEAVEQVLPEVDDSAEEVADSLELEQGTPQSLAIMLGKVAVVSDTTKKYTIQFDIRRVVISRSAVLHCKSEEVRSMTRRPSVPRMCNVQPRGCQHVKCARPFPCVIALVYQRIHQCADFCPKGSTAISLKYRMSACWCTYV